MAQRAIKTNQIGRGVLSQYKADAQAISSAQLQAIIPCANRIMTWFTEAPFLSATSKIEQLM